MKNDDMQRMGVTPWLGDTRVKDKGGKAAKRTLTDLCREARAVRDECRALRDECNKAMVAVEFARRMMRRDLVRLAWFAGGCTLVNVAVWFAVVLC